MRIGIGGFTIGVKGPSDLHFVLDPDMQKFVVSNVDAVDCELRVRRGDPVEPSGAPLFDSGSTWRVRQINGSPTYSFFSASLGPRVFKEMTLTADRSAGEITVSRDVFQDGAHIDPLEYPLSELLVMQMLRQSDGAEVHACGVQFEGKGLLFVGHSGAGKSTTARMWMKRKRAVLLSDDRIVLRKKEGGIRMYGTPWHGDAGVANPVSCTLDRIFILEQAAENRWQALSPVASVAELMARSFYPLYDSVAIERTMSFLTGVVDTVACGVFSFRPEQSALDIACSMIGAEKA